MRAPLIGVSLCLDPGVELRPGRDSYYVGAGYARAVQAAGGVPVMVAPDGPAEVVDRLDGLVISGGDDIPAHVFGQAPVAGTKDEAMARVRGDLALLARARAADLPTLCVCYGMQLLNVARGGDLVQALPTAPLDHGAPGRPTRHPVTVAEDARWLGPVAEGGRIETHSAHRQAIRRLGDGLRVTATAADGTIEAIEDPAARFLLGVQWHPEGGPDGAALYGLLVARARETGAR